MTHTDAINKMRKIYNLYVDGAAAAGEKTSAYDKLKKLARKHKVNLSEFIETMDFDREFDARAQAKAEEAERARKEAESKEYKERKVRPSRRSVIINCLRENIWSVDDILDVLEQVYGYNDRKANKKAVSGTRYDFNVNKGYHFKTCEGGRVFTTC